MDKLNIEPENIDEKAKKTDIIEPKLETGSEIEISDNIRKAGQEWRDNFLQRIETTQQELNDKAIAVLFEEINAPQIDRKVKDMFIDDDECFSKDITTDDDKKFIRGLLGKSNYYFGEEEQQQQQQQQANLSYSKPTGKNTIDEINYNNWLNNLENSRPDLLISDENDDRDFKVVEQTPKNDDDNDVYVKYVHHHQTRLFNHLYIHKKDLKKYKKKI